VENQGFLYYDKRMKKYLPNEIEPKWQAKWEEAKLYQAIDFDKKPKKYILIEFPYPSGERLHVGHGRSYCALDAYSRKLRMEGFNVLYPIGWDAFGLPAENYAIKTGINPNITTKKNIANSRKQAKRWGLSFDWEREIDTTDPKYYKWTQWIFIQMFEKGLAYKEETPVGWCPACKIVLANEEIVGGQCERCGHEAERKMQSQWILKITEYAQRLLDDLKEVNYLPKIRIQQENWIGRTEGVTIDYPVLDSDKIVSCYSTRPDTNFGATFIVIAPEHPMVLELTTQENLGKIKNYIKQSLKKSELERTELEKEKTGVFTGSYALNRLTKKKMPIWVSDFVVLTAGTGIVVGVPAHDERDWQFAKKYGLEIIPVIKPKKGKWDFEKGPFTDLDEAIVFNSDFLDGLPALEAKEKIIDYLVKKEWGKRAVNYHLRDWIFSRQHYWGEPIPMINCQKCGWVAVPEKDLPVELPYIEKYKPTKTGESPLAVVKDWVETKCPECGGPGKRETDTMPNWAGSNWYYLRYIDPKNDKELANRKKLDYWMPVDLYNGGMEHTTLHLLYSRFIYKFLADIKVVPDKEPYARRHSHGVVLGPDGRKMSKSLGNVVNPDEIVKEYGADTFRLYEMFMGPFEQMIPWSHEGVQGCYRFLKKVWQLYQSPRHLRGGRMDSSEVNDLSIKLHQTIKKVTEDLNKLKFNTAVAAMMEFSNAWMQKGNLSKTDAELFLRLLAPFAPHITEELYYQLDPKPYREATSSAYTLGAKYSIHQQPWPKFDPKLTREEKVEIVIQVNGKLRDRLKLESQKAGEQETVENLAKESEKVKKYLQGKKVKKTIFVPGKLINFVV